MHRYKRVFFAILFCSFAQVLAAQEFQVKAALEKVSIQGFYKIPVRPDLTAHVKTDLSDLRITDHQHKQVPFIIRHSFPIISSSSFIEFPIIKTTTDSVATTLEVACPIDKGNDHISLVIANHAVERSITISGSNDRQQWFIIEDHILLSSSGQDERGSFVQSVQFPFSKYSYYKLVINNAHTDPLNIIKTGIYTSQTETGTQLFTANPPLNFVQKDSSNGTSYITLNQKEAYHLERIVLQIDGAKYYKRVAHLYQLADKRMKNHIATFEIASNRLPAVSFGTIKAKNLLIEIENKDNPPLVVTAIRTEQSKRDLVAYLENGESYFIMAGNERIQAPQYDLMQFRDSIPAQLAILSYKDIQPAGVTVRNRILPDTRYWLWPAILIVISALGFLTYKLLADMKRSGI